VEQGSLAKVIISNKGMRGVREEREDRGGRVKWQVEDAFM